MGFYAPAQLVWDARQHNIEVRPVDVNHSDWDSTIEGGAARLGMRMLGGMRISEAELIVTNRSAGHYGSMDDFMRRSRVASATLTRLARADAFASLKLSRRASLWQTLQQEKKAKAQPLFDGLIEPINTAALPPMTPQQEVFADYRAAGLSLKDHPIKFFREQLDKLKVIPAKHLPDVSNGSYVRVAGIVLVRQRPGTAKGITFVTIEDEFGPINLIIRMEVWNKFYKIAHTASGYIAHGKLKNYKGVIHFLVFRLENLPQALGEAKVKSKDFH
jgi:error-prone DNA polymerase